MKKIFTLTNILLFIAIFGANAQMTDNQVLSYMKAGLSYGKTEKQIATELIAKGVTVQQMERLRDQYQNDAANGSVANGTMNIGPGVNKRIGTANVGLLGESEISLYNITSTLDSLEIDSKKPREIYGHRVFSSKTLSFEPSESLATPENYVLGPGDEVVIEIWGANEASIREIISPEGRISVSQIGPIYLNGLTIKQANAHVRKVFAQKYAGVLGDAPMSDISVSLGSVKTIQVNVFGEVEVPGTYRLSGFSTVFHALYRAGGVTELGSVRNINVVRGGKVIANVDIYPYLIEGRIDTDVRLQDGDVIKVPVYENLVNVDGLVKRPMDYEMKQGETVKKLLDYAGGFAGGAYTGQVRVNRVGENQRSILTVLENDYSSVLLAAGDSVSIDGMVAEKFANKVEIQGKVFRPGAYAIGSEIKTVKDLVVHAGGVLEDAFLARVRIERTKDDLTAESLSFNLANLLAGKSADITLRKNDVVIVDDLHMINEIGTLTINGFVNEPQTIDFVENMTIEDLILFAGGLQRGASSARVEVSRRLMNDGSVMPNDTLSRIYTFPLDITLAHNDANDFKLEPYDIVSVRKSPDYRPQANVTIDGEVAFPGDYSMVTVGERISSIIQRAGGLTPHAYIKGATLRRVMSEEDKTLQKAVDKMTKNGATKELLDESLVDLDKEIQNEEVEAGEEYYSVALELDKALMNPGSDFDLVLKEGDKIMVPEYLSTVKITGTVMFPNSVAYKSGASVGYYINKAGGYGYRAKRSRAYIVYMNGNVSKARFGTKIEPGSEIIVPARSDKGKTSASEILATTSAATSITTAIATLARLFF